jgi:predicted component of type VI protein secretion system
MRATLVIGAVLTALAFTAGCGALGYQPDEAVSVKVVASNDANQDKTGGRPLDLYFARVNEPMTYEGSDISELRVTKELTVPGGRSIKRFTVSPGETVTVELGPMVYEHFTHVGVFAAYGTPAGESGSQVRTAEIPSDGKLVLLVGANAIQKFDDLDD